MRYLLVLNARMRLLCRITALALLTTSIVYGQQAGHENADLQSARLLFEENVAAIRNKDRAKYLSLYLKSAQLVRTGPGGFQTGYVDFERSAGERWPDALDVSQMKLTVLHPGLVYGTYRYRVRYGAEEHIGISERLFTRTAYGWKIALTGAIDTPANIPAPPRAIVGATLIDGRGGPPVRNANVIMANGEIDCAGTAAQCPVPEGIDRIEGGGLWVTPGLIDAHVHFSQSGWVDSRPDALDLRPASSYENTEADLEAHPERFGRSYLCSGVTSVFDAGGYPWTLSLPKRYAADTAMPQIVASGPMLSTIDHWLNLPAERQYIHIRDESSARSGVRYLVGQGSAAINVWNVPGEASAGALTAARDEAGKEKRPFVVHASGLAEAKAALRAGTTVLAHSVEDVPVDEEFIRLAKQNGTIVIPTLTVVEGYVRMYRGVKKREAPKVDDPNRCVDAATLARIAELPNVNPAQLDAENVAATEQRAERFNLVARANLKRLAAAGIPIATGTDAGNPLTLHGPAIYAEMEAMQASGMTPMQVIVASTATAARAMGKGEKSGTIEKGRTADVLLLAADPSVDVANFRKIRQVIRAGVVRSIEDLSAMAR